MNKALTAPTELRVLLQLVTSRDTDIAIAMLARSGIVAEACEDAAALAKEMAEGTGAVVIAEEVLDDQGYGRVLHALRSQPPWSDLPVIVAARSGAEALESSEAIEQLGNVTVLERPMRVSSLASSVQSALKARKRQYQLRSTLEGLREADQRKTEFLATMAHELRNPLAPLRTALNIVSTQQPTPEKRKALHAMMDRQVTHMVHLIDDLMEVSRVTHGKIALRTSVIALGDVVRDAVEVTRPLITAAHQNLLLELPPVACHVLGDEVRLAQVFSNLLNNASKFTPSKGNIRVSMNWDEETVRVQVIDSGIGIPEDMLETVFGMFVQITGTQRAVHAGLGIGLTLVRSLVELHGGRVYASSAGTNEGTTMTVELPRVVAPESENTAASDGAEWNTAARQKVLVVDDNRDAADSLAQLLELLGANASVAYGGEEALNVMMSSHPAVAFVDIGMPGMNGYEVASKIRATDTLAGTVLIALTGWGQATDRERILNSGFDHHLIKPADIQTLTQLLNSFA